jgi:hypothetical protein
MLDLYREEVTQEKLELFYKSIATYLVLGVPLALMCVSLSNHSHYLEPSCRMREEPEPPMPEIEDIVVEKGEIAIQREPELEP